MRRATVLSAILAGILLLFLHTGSASATDWYYGGLYNDYAAAITGIKADVSATERHQYGEEYDVTLWTTDGEAFLHLMLVKDAGYHTFRLTVHLTYKTAAQNPYNPTSRHHEITYGGGYTGWHNLKIALNSGTYWKVYIDNTVKDWYVNWPYSGPSSYTWADATYGDGVYPGTYLNHHDNVWILRSGSWSLQTEATYSAYLGTAVSPPYQYTVINNEAHYDWMGIQ